MPWAAHRVVHHQSLVKRAAQMTAGRADREDLVAEPSEQRLGATDMTCLHTAIGYVGNSNASGKIGSEVGCVAQSFLSVLSSGSGSVAWPTARDARASYAPDENPR